MEHFYDIRIGIFFILSFFFSSPFLYIEMCAWHSSYGAVIFFLKIENKNDILWYDKNLFS